MGGYFLKQLWIVNLRMFILVKTRLIKGGFLYCGIFCKTLTYGVMWYIITMKW